MTEYDRRIKRIKILLGMLIKEAISLNHQLDIICCLLQDSERKNVIDAQKTVTK
ncbi:hypothetical protein SAMN05216302_101476 [Nitrosomonas aestuarii]|uniref:Uncharacterized protein n=1 Tax=Nitrosomonas aestuarii TaxID=52441 RepID=A0A1I4C5U9_9PROT|nr:hypothetical protein SAMN05216302_101476 [Nitrosomonas aestuarii]